MISIIIPVFNAEKTIGKTIEALLKQNYSKKNYEIIIVDDGSTDKTIEVVSKLPVKLIKLKHKGPANARNIGAKKSRGDIILFTDADCIPDKNWIKNMISPFKNKEVVGVSGTYKTLNKDILIARFLGYEIEYRHEKMKKKKYIDFIGTFSAAYRKSVFLEVGGFDTSFSMSSGEDPELSYRISKKHKLVFQPSAFVWHPHPDTLSKFLRQKFWRVYWRFLMYRKHKKKMLGDSYTSTESIISMGFQILSIGIIGLLLIFSFFISIPYYFLILFILLTISLPNINFIFWAFKRDKIISIISPLLFFLRNFIFFLAFILGIINLLKK